MAHLLVWMSSSGAPAGPIDTMLSLLGGTLDGMAVLLLAWILTACYRWDEDGLQWCTWGVWTAIDWTDVYDFYLLPSRGGGTSLVLETAAGQRRLSSLWDPLINFRLAVSANALGSSTRYWHKLGCRHDDGREICFSYRPRLAVTFATIAAALAVSALILAAADPIGHFDAVANAFGRGVAGGTIFLAALLPLAAIFYGYAAACLAFDSVHRTNQTIIASREGIIFEDNTCSIRVSWMQVIRHRPAWFSRYLMLPARHVVETDEGTFDFTADIGDYSVLRAVLNYWAPDAREESLPALRDCRGRVRRRHARPLAQRAAIAQQIQSLRGGTAAGMQPTQVSAP